MVGNNMNKIQFHRLLTSFSLLPYTSTSTPIHNILLIGLLLYSPVPVKSLSAAAAAAGKPSSAAVAKAIHTRSLFGKLLSSSVTRSTHCLFESRRSSTLQMVTSSNKVSSISTSTPSATSSSPTHEHSIKYIDAGTNLLDSMYTGIYHSKPYHDDDLHLVLQRAYSSGIDKLICLAGSIQESRRLLELMECLDSNKLSMSGDVDNCDDSTNDAAVSGERVQVFGTVGVHPTRTAEVFADKIPSSSEGEVESFTWRPKPQEQQAEIIQQLIQLVTSNNKATNSSSGNKSNNIVAIGECGLDYARLEYSPREIQLVGLQAQLQVARATGLPLYLHNRESGQELYQILLEYKEELSREEDGVRLRGVVHSFDEDIDIANQFLSLGLYIGINGCSLKTLHNLQVVQQLSLNRLILETDCPWCDIRPTHASYQYVQTTFPTLKEKQYSKEVEKEKYCVKNRTEPCHVVQVAEVIAALHGVEVQEVATVCRQNVLDLFGDLEK